MKDLFSFHYPERAGFKERDTSKQAADEIEGSGRAGTLRAKVWAMFERGYEGTADSVAGELNEDILAIRPRVSELRAKGLIEPTGKRGFTSNGKAAHVWRKTRSET